MDDYLRCHTTAANPRRKQQGITKPTLSRNEN